MAQLVDEIETDQRERKDDAEIDRVAVLEALAAGALDAVERPIGEEVQAGANQREVKQVNDVYLPCNPCSDCGDARLY